MTFTCYGTSSKNEYANFEVQSVPMGGTLSNATWFYGSGADSDAVSYYQVSVPSTGYLKVSLTTASGNSYPTYNIVLCNSSKSSYYSGYEYLSSGSNGSTTNIGVRKGTYYIAVKSGDPAYGIMATFSKAKVSATGTKKSRSKSIYKKSTRRGVLAASSGISNWYKFKVSKKQVVKFSVSTLTSTGGSYSIGGVQVTVYKGKQSIYSYFYYGKPSGYIQPYNIYKGHKLSKGTYYIKVSKFHGGNGYYSLKWK